MRPSTSAGIALALYEKLKAEFKEFAIPGPRGKQGPRGEKGFDGKDGTDGKDGRDGIDGKDGNDGTDGKDGRDGIDGKDGNDGRDGVDGTNGKDGRDGIDGKDGRDGTDGKDGAKGPKGDKGDPGKDGRDGVDGKDGNDGRDGIDGRDGTDGKDGKRGPKGDKGDPGKDGRDGVDGKDGRDGKDAEVPDLDKLLSSKIDPQFQNMNKWRENINKSLASLGGGGSYKILDNADVEKTKLSDAAENAILIFNKAKGKFVVTDIEQVLLNLQVQIEMQYTRLIDEDGDNTYIGEANPGTAQSAASWRIKRVYTNPVTGDIDIEWADGTADFTKVWDNRLTYTYS